MTAEEMENLVEKNLTSVFQFCCHLTGSRAEAEDLCQDTFLKAVELRHRLNCCGGGNEARNYFIGIAVNLWRNKRRKQMIRQRIAPMDSRSEEVLLNVSDGRDIENHMLRQELIQEIGLQIQKLPDKQRIVINLYYSAEMSVEEISEILHVPKETVKSRIRLAKQKMKRNLEVQGYATER